MPRSGAVAVLLALAVPAQAGSKPAPTLPPPEVTLVLCDGSILKGVTLPAALEVATRYGRLVVPSKDILRIEVGLRLGGLPWLGAWEQDTITTADCVLTGRLAAEALKVRSRVLGEVDVRVADVRSIHSSGCNASPTNVSVAEQQRLIQQITQLVEYKVPDSVIINKIRTSGVVYRLTEVDVVGLRLDGVSAAVVAEMLATAGRGRTAGDTYDPKTGRVRSYFVPAGRYDLPPLRSAPESTPPLPPVP